MIRQQIPNVITGMRILLVPLLAWLIMEHRYVETLLLFTLMGLSDGLDGYLAKHFNWTTRFGAFLDPLADKAMLICAFVTLGAQTLVPVWLVIAVVVRDIVIFTGAVAYHFTTHKLLIVPSQISKINTFMQILVVLFAILNQLVWVPQVLFQGLIVVTLATTIFSGIDYIMVWSKRAMEALRNETE